MVSVSSLRSLWIWPLRLRLWHRLSKRRRQRLHVYALSDHLLRDIGLGDRLGERREH